MLQNIKESININSIKNVIILVLVIILTFTYIGNSSTPETVKVPTTIIVEKPEIKGTSTLKVLPSPIKTVEIGRSTVDSTLLHRFSKATDSIEKLHLYIDAISKNNYSVEYKDSIQSVVVHSNVRGKLLSQKIDYTIFKSTSVVDTIIPIKIPNKNKLLYSIELGVPFNNVKPNLILKGNIIFKNKKDYFLNIGVSSNKVVWGGFTKEFKL